MSNSEKEQGQKRTQSMSEGHCNFFVKRKKRYCRMKVKESELYCCEHQIVHTDVEQSNLDKIRIPCPLDNKHTCYQNKLQKHLRICNARPKDSHPFILKGVNSGCSPDGIKDEEGIISLSDHPVSNVMNLIDRIKSIYVDKNMEPTEKISKHAIVEDEMKLPIYGDKTKKHLKQISSILGLLLDYELLNKDTCFVEFGAGRGALSYWVSKATSNEANIILVEKASPKHKKDNKLDKTTEKIERIRADIEDLVLDKLDLVNQSKHVVALTKHLCGAATDFTLRCLSNSLKNKHKIDGFILTYCCHHRCSWSSFTGKKYFEELGLSENDFRIMCGLVGWATCGSRNKGDEIENASFVEKNEKFSYNMNYHHRRDVGLICKHLINWGRSKFIEDAGFKSNLHYYVKNDVTLENVCVVAINKNQERY